MKTRFGGGHWTQGWRRGLAIALTLGSGGITEAVLPQPGHPAEQVQFNLVGPATVSVSVESLRLFAETGVIRSDLRLFMNVVDEPTRVALRDLLRRPIPFDAVSISNITYSPLGRDALTQLSDIIRVSPEVSGFHALRAAVINAAVQADETGWTALDVLEQFPRPRIEVQVGDMLALVRSLADYAEFNQAMVAAIRQQAQLDAAATGPIDAAQLPDLSQPGAFTWTTGTLSVNNPALAQTQQGLTVNYDFDVDIYLPDGLAAPAPIVIISHGFGALKENFIFLAEHLASHGYVVLVPDHVGSDLAYRQRYLEGQLNTLLSPIEFIDRPQEISFLIDELERQVATDPQWQARLDVERIAVIGDSLGSTAVLSLAGATFNIDRLRNECQRPDRLVNASLYLQCRVRYLPPTRFDLADERIRAAIAAHPFGYGLFGPEEMGAIEVPLMLVAGSEDIVAPVVLEQFYPFMWLQNEHRYLAMLDPGSHFSTKPEGAAGAERLPTILAGRYGEFGQLYYRTLTVAFLNAYVRDDPAAQPYLTAAYAESLSAGAPMQLDLIQALPLEQIAAAYGRSPLYPLDPPAAVVPPPLEQSILAQLAAEPTLPVALRRDSPPLGYLGQADELLGAAPGGEPAAGDRWTGYCVDLVNGLADYLSAELDIPQGVVPSELPSTVTNRYALVRDGTVALECGPNSIRSDIEGVQFSEPFFVAGTRMLIPDAAAGTINPNRPLPDVRIGVLQDTTTAAFVESAYPEATVVPFTGVEAREEGIRALADGAIAAFAGDGILLWGEALHQGLNLADYEFVPELPLTCEFYGLALPADDPAWQRTVNAFLASDRHTQIFTRWFGAVTTAELDNADFCLNR